MINDFSARDVQAEEIASGGFGFVKSKNFCTAMGNVVVTADDMSMGAQLWMPGDMGALFCGEGLKCAVTVDGAPGGDGKYGGAMKTSQPRCCLLADYVRAAALGEGLAVGEVLGMGTIPGCAGVEVHEWLKPGQTITVECDLLGALTNVVGTPRDGPDYKQLGVEAEERADRFRGGRLGAAIKFATLAVVAPPLVFLLMVFGFVSALLWPGPKTPPGLVGATKIPVAAKGPDFSMWPGSDNSHVAPSKYEGGYEDKNQHAEPVLADYERKKRA